MNSILVRLSHKLNVSVAVALLALVGVIASHAVQAQQYADETTGTVTEPLGETYAEPKKLAPGAARVVLYRPEQGNASGVSSVVINEHYHTSLQFGSFSELCMPPGRLKLASHMVQTGAVLKDNEDATAALPIKAGQTVYLRLRENGDNRATITPVTAGVARSELNNARRQLHAVSRVPNRVECLPIEARPVKKAEDITLGADALFAFGKSDIKGISAQGREELDQLIANLQKKYGKQEGVRIQIAGHADPLGNPAANKRLSEARAQAIRGYLVQGGMNPKTLTAVGIGAAQPVITTCDKTATPEAIACNKPNRRVVVGVQTLAR
jgi:outer membrane protein OmpA-like peptidoglycan-associated protein